MKKLDRFMFSFQKTFSWFVDSHFAQNLLVFKNLLQFCFADSIPFFKKKFWHCFFFCLTRVVSPLGKVNWPIHSPAVWSSSYCTLHKNCGTAEVMSLERERNQNVKHDLRLIYISCESIILQESFVHGDIQYPPFPLCYLSLVHVILLHVISSMSLESVRNQK